MPDFFVSPECAISRFAKAKNAAAPPLLPRSIPMNWHLTVVTANGQRIPFHANVGSQTEIRELASQARLLKRVGADLDQLTGRQVL